MPEITPLDRSHNRSGFDCGVPDLNAFLRATARQHGQKGISRTFVLTDGTPDILGFFSLALCEAVLEELPAPTPAGIRPTGFPPYVWPDSQYHGSIRGRDTANCCCQRPFTALP